MTMSRVASNVTAQIGQTLSAVDKPSSIGVFFNHAQIDIFGHEDVWATFIRIMKAMASALDQISDDDLGPFVYKMVATLCPHLANDDEKIIGDIGNYIKVLYLYFSLHLPLQLPEPIPPHVISTYETLKAAQTRSDTKGMFKHSAEDLYNRLISLKKSIFSFQVFKNREDREVIKTAFADLKKELGQDDATII